LLNIFHIKLIKNTNETPTYHHQKSENMLAEKIKFVGMVAILGGVGALIYQSATQNARLHEAIDNIRTAQSLIKCSIDTIESAKTDIKGVKENLKSLQTMAVITQKDLEFLRQERQQLEKTIKETLSNSRTIIRGQKDIVDEFQNLKKTQDSIVDNVSPLITVAFSPKTN
jgi:chromosome segregation ATPase